MPSVMDRRPMPRSASSAARSTSPFIVLPRRSSFHTTSTSPSRACDNASAKPVRFALRSEEHTSELQPLMRISYAVFCLKKKTHKQTYQRKLAREPYYTHIERV